MHPIRKLQSLVCWVLAASLLWVAVPSPALDFVPVDSFMTESVSPSRPRSMAVDSEQGMYLMAFADGSVIEVREESTREVLPPLHPPEPPRTSVGQPGYNGLTLVQPLGMFVGLQKYSAIGFDFYTLSGQLVQSTAFTGVPMYNGVFFEQRDEVGDLHAIYSLSVIEVRRLKPPHLRPHARIYVPTEIRDRARAPVDRSITGIVYWPQPDVHLLSLFKGEVVAIGRGQRLISGWAGKVVGESDLKPHGVQAIDDITWDAALELLYVVDSGQRRVFTFELSGAVPRFHRGDPDGSGSADVGDAVSLLNHLFQGTPAPSCLESADVNNDGALDVSDPIALLRYLFLGGDAPAKPGPPGLPCGPEPDLLDAHVGLGCKEYLGCK